MCPYASLASLSGVPRDDSVPALKVAHPATLSPALVAAGHAALAKPGRTFAELLALLDRLPGRDG